MSVELVIAFWVGIVAVVAGISFWLEAIEDGRWPPSRGAK